MNIFTRLFKKSLPTKQEETITEVEKPKYVPNIKNLNDIALFDDVWIKINGVICEGWVTKREGTLVEIVYTNPESRLIETSFKIERPLDRQVLEQGNKILYLTKDAIQSNSN